MIQRIQTIFLLLAGVAFGVGAFMESSVLWLCVLLGLLAVVSLAIIFLYKRRPTQATCCAGAMGLALVYYIMLAVNQPQMAWHMAMPLVGILFLFLARKSILKDEKLVRSLDRIR